MWSTMMPYQLTLGAVLDRAGKQFRDVEIVSARPDGTLHRSTYGDFYQRARRLAEGLQRMGVRRGERVATLMHNDVCHLEAYFGIAACGGVVHPLNVRLHPNDLSYIINHANDRFLIVDDTVLPVVEALRGQIVVEHIIVVPTTGARVPKMYIDYETVIGQAHDSFLDPSLHENEAAVLCYTTGTAGSPKGIVYSHRALVLHALAIALPDALAIARADVVLPVVPMYHANAWGLPIASAMIGCKQVFAGNDTNPASLLNLFASERVTLSAAVPTVWAGVLHEMERQPEKWKVAMRAVASGAAPAEPVIRALDNLGIRLMQAWGLVETDSLATIATGSTPGEDDYSSRMTLGRPLPFIEVRVIGETGEVPHDNHSMGEVQVRGPWVTASYYNLPELRGKWTDDGWFRTGDVVTVDELGRMHMADRAKDLIRAGDDWISSVDLENELMGHPAIKEAAVIAVPHPQMQERPLAAVVLKEFKQATPHELRTHLANRFAQWQLPDAFVFVDSLPHTPTGKLLKKELRKQFKNWRWEQVPESSRM